METNSSPAIARHPAHMAIAPMAGAIDVAPRAAKQASKQHASRPYQLVAGRVRELVAQLGVAPGERLPSERELASALAVSRATLRQALTSLELGGVVEVRSCSGVYLCPQPLAAAPVAQAVPGPFELLSARRLIEPELAAMAARVATDGNIDAILAAAAGMARSVAQRQREPGDEHPDCERADRHFHLTLARATGNGALASVLEQLWSQRGGLWPTLEQLFDAEGLREPTLADYRRIAGAVAARDPAAARNAMRTHLERFTRMLSRG